MIRAYNGPQLGAAIDSALCQSYKNKEILVYDDASTEWILSSVKGIKLFKGKKNIGDDKAANFLLSKCKGEYFIFLDHDDTFFNRDSVEVLYQSIGDADCVIGDLLVTERSTFADPNKIAFGKWEYSRINIDKNTFRIQIIENGGCGIIPFVKGLHRKKFWDDNKIKFELPIVGDTLASIRMIEAGGNIYYIPLFICSFKATQTGLSFSKDREKQIKNMLKILK